LLPSNQICHNVRFMAQFFRKQTPHEECVARGWHRLQKRGTTRASIFCLVTFFFYMKNQDISKVLAVFSAIFYWFQLFYWICSSTTDNSGMARTDVFLQQ
jgi:hypothetical protein